MKIFQSVLSTVSLILVPVIGLGLFLLVRMEYFKEGNIERNIFGNCHYLDEIVYGVEDITKFNSSTLLFPSGDILRLYVLGEPLDVQPGAIYAIYNAEDKNFKIQKLYIHDFPMNTVFQPHGIYLKTHEDGTYLYAVNHAFHRISERLECFKIVDVNGSLRLDYKYSVYFPEEYNGILDDVVVLSKSHFIVTQFIPYPVGRKGVKYTTLRTKLMLLYSALTNQRQTYALSCSFPVHRDVHVHFPTCIPIGSTEGISNTGITFDGQNIYILDYMAKNIRKFKMIPEAQGMLEQIDMIEVDGNPVSIEYNEHIKKIQVTVIYKYWDCLMVIIELIKNGGEIKNTQDLWSAVYQVDLNLTNLTILHLDKNISALSSASYQIGKNLFIGSPAQQPLVVCSK